MTGDIEPMHHGDYLVSRPLSEEMRERVDRMTRSAQFTVQMQRMKVMMEAREWIGTPFHHSQAVKGVGVDCAQLLIAVYRAVGLVDADGIEFYGEDWFLHEKRERLLDVIERYCVPTEAPRTGDIVTFRFGRAVSHAAIVTEWPHIIHAERMIGRVVEDRCDVHDTLASRYVGGWTLQRWATVEGFHV